MRQAKEHGAIAALKDGRLLFLRQRQGKTASGKVLPAVTITRAAGDSHRFPLADWDAYTGVVASWLHTQEPKKSQETQVKRRRRLTRQKKTPEAKERYNQCTNINCGHTFITMEPLFARSRSPVNVNTVPLHAKGGSQATLNL